MPKISFSICDQSYIIRKGLASVIEKIPNTQVYISTDTIEDLFTDKEPDFIVINSSITKHNELKQLKLKFKSAQLVALSSSPLVEFHKDEWAETISINENQIDIIKKINKLIGDRESYAWKNNTITNEISKREIDILKNIALGFSNKEIADKLFISAHTVVTHRKNITRKLGIKTVSGLTIYAILNNIIDIKDAK